MRGVPCTETVSFLKGLMYKKRLSGGVWGRRESALGRFAVVFSRQSGESTTRLDHFLFLSEALVSRISG